MGTSYGRYRKSANGRFHLHLHLTDVIELHLTDVHLNQLTDVFSSSYGRYGVQSTAYGRFQNQLTDLFIQLTDVTDYGRFSHTSYGRFLNVRTDDTSYGRYCLRTFLITSYVLRTFFWTSVRTFFLIRTDVRERP